MTIQAYLLAVLLLLTAGVPASGQELNEQQKQTYQRVCQSLLAPCCWREPIAIHRSQESLAARDEVAELVLAGKSEGEIIDSYVARYGEPILIEPQGGKSTWLYVIPAVLLLAGLAVVLWFVSTHRRRRAVVAGPAAEVDESEWDW